MSDRKESGNFLNRWSVRKQQSARPVVNDDAARETGTESELPEATDAIALLNEKGLQDDLSGTELQNENLVPVEQAEVLLTDADMPDVETLTASSDISGFLGKGISAELRKAALRHVFRQPRYNVRDGLDDYDDDYTVFEPLGDTVTADMKFHSARKERARLESELLAEEQTQMQSGIPDSAETAQNDATTVGQEQATETGNEEIITRQEEGSIDYPDQYPSTEVTVQDDSGRDAEQSVEQPAVDYSEEHIPMNKTSQAKASQPRETSNE